MSRTAFILALVLSLACVSWAQSSRNGMFQVEVEIHATAKKWPEGNSWKATVYDSAGVLRYQIAKEIPYDVQYPAIRISDAGGRCIVFSPFEGWVEFYNGEGNIVGTMSPFIGEAPTYERILKCSVAGERAAFLVSEPLTASARVMLTDLEGNEIWNASFSLETAAEVFLSTNGDYVLAGSYSSGDRIERSTVLLDRRGNILRTFDTIFRHADFAEEDGRVVFTERNGIVIASIDGKEASVRWSTKDRNEVVTGVRFAAGHVGVVVEKVTLETGKPRYNNPQLVVLNQQGQQVLNKQLHQISEDPASLKIDGETLTVSSGSAKLQVDVSKME